MLVSVPSDPVSSFVEKDKRELSNFLSHLLFLTHVHTHKSRLKDILSGNFLQLTDLL